MWRPQVLHVGLALLPSDGSEVLGTADPPLFGYAFAETLWSGLHNEDSAWLLGPLTKLVRFIWWTIDMILMGYQRPCYFLVHTRYITFYDTQRKQAKCLLHT